MGKVCLGFGVSIPPLLAHVEIYFLQAGCSVNQAHSFFEWYTALNWKYKNGNPVSNWKKVAWEWVYWRNI
ncbi:hypothetical protein DBR32_12580 [Taibaiella sp. KBW10]|nr:hypothetical protein DBR32_12580 [Taibaiella sp. KBW10]